MRSEAEYHSDTIVGRRPSRTARSRPRSMAGCCCPRGARIEPRDRDRLDRGQPVRGEQVGALFEVCLEVVVADGLDHLDGDELVVLPPKVPVVFEQHRDTVLQPRRAHAVGALVDEDLGVSQMCGTNRYVAVLS